MKLYLTSTAILPQHQQEFLRLVGKSASEVNCALIENAADPYSEERRSFVKRDFDLLSALGMHIVLMDLREINGADFIRHFLIRADVVWLGGGNTFYLRELMRTAGFDQAIHSLMERGLIYGGGSAGAIVAGPTLAHFDMADDPSQAGTLIEEGLGLTEVVTVPHWGHPRYGEPCRQIKEKLDALGHRAIPITDEQAIVIDGEEVRVLS